LQRKKIIPLTTPPPRFGETAVGSVVVDERAATGDLKTQSHRYGEMDYYYYYYCHRGAYIRRFVVYYFACFSEHHVSIR
jgi:hypothetical protein